MDIATILGVVLAISMILMGMELDIDTFSDQTSVLIVCGGIYIFIREKVQDQSIVTEKPLR